MMDVTRDKVCLIYTLIHNDIDINVGAMIFLVMNKAHYHQGHRYGFDGFVTRFLRNQVVEEEALDYRPVVDNHSVDCPRLRV